MLLYWEEKEQWHHYRAMYIYEIYYCEEIRLTGTRGIKRKCHKSCKFNCGLIIPKNCILLFKTGNSASEHAEASMSVNSHNTCTCSICHNMQKLA